MGKMEILENQEKEEKMEEIMKANIKMFLLLEVLETLQKNNSLNLLVLVATNSLKGFHF